MSGGGGILDGMAYLCRRTCAAALISVFIVSCRPQSSPPAPGPDVYRGQERFGLSFEERMALPAELSRLRTDAQQKADEIYDPFRSKEDAIRNEEMRVHLYDEARERLIDENALTPAELDEIIREYQLSLGGNLR